MPLDPSSTRFNPSSTNPENDLFKKLVVYQRAEVPHDWIIDPVAEALAVYRWTPDEPEDGGGAHDQGGA